MNGAIVGAILRGEPGVNGGNREYSQWGSNPRYNRIRDYSRELVGKLGDSRRWDLKSSGGDTMRVRAPPPAPPEDRIR